MLNQTKKVKGQLLDITNKKLLSDINVEITLLKTQTDKPEFQVSGIVQGYKPEFADKSHILKIKEELLGEVFIAIDGIPDGIQTHYKIYFQESIWNNIDWFEALPIE